MTLVIGTDEAGYGPNLGPLVIASSVWRLDDRGGRATDPAAVEARLSRATAAVAAAAGLPSLPWDDSKKLHTPGAGLAALERGVLAALAASDAAGTAPADGKALAGRLGLDAEAAPAEWPRFLARVLPLDAPADAVTRLADAIRVALPREGVTLVGLAACVVHPARFNRLLDEGSNKSDILSRLSLALAAGLRAVAPEEPALLWCDRHGGRKSYAGLVGRHFDETLVRTLEECPARSRYALGGAAETTIEFTVGGEGRVPVALASMTAKYVRELAMGAFNGHWGDLLPGLLPTAGYPLDARRWLADAGPVVRGAGLPIDHLWRRV